jgi:hypothetical protein
MTLDELRQALDALTDLPGHLDVNYVTRTGTVKPIEALRWSPLIGFAPSGGIAAFEKDRNRN